MPATCQRPPSCSNLFASTTGKNLKEVTFLSTCFLLLIFSNSIEANERNEGIHDNSSALGGIGSKDINGAATTAAAATNESLSWLLITRTEWQARAPITKKNFTGPPPYVILHHSFQPGICLTRDACSAAMRSMQNFHMDSHGWPDIGYSFAIGGDGNVYEARGYDVVGAHAPNYNSRSIGLLLIGNFMENLPPPPMLQIAKDFLKYSVDIGNLREDYILYGHRQVRNTACPGDVLFKEIQTWPHWREVE